MVVYRFNEYIKNKFLTKRERDGRGGRRRFNLPEIPHACYFQLPFERTSIPARFCLLLGRHQRRQTRAMAATGQFRGSLSMRGVIFTRRNEMRMASHRHCTHERSIRRSGARARIEGISSSRTSMRNTTSV